MPIEFWDGRYKCQPRMASVFPDGVRHGRARIEHLKVTKESAAWSWFSVAKTGRGYLTEGDVYAALYVGDTLWMSDTPDERADHFDAILHARGDVLIAGLGLGYVTLACAFRPDVRTVTVVELDADVIALVQPYLDQHADNIRYVQADIFEWRPEKGARYDCLWFDIWQHLCTDDLEEHTRLSRSFARFRAPGSYRGFWGHELLLRHRRRERKENRRYNAF